MNPIEPGSLRHTVLVYAVSEPGEWTPDTICEDLPGTDEDAILLAIGELFDWGYIHINSFDQRIWPLRAGREAIAQAV